VPPRIKEVNLPSLNELDCWGLLRDVHDSSYVSALSRFPIVHFPESAKTAFAKNNWERGGAQYADGWMIEQSSADLFRFSTGFFHCEGEQDPLKRFSQALNDYKTPEEKR
jgi:hypothetical protein